MGKINNYDGLLKGRQRRGLPGPPGPPGPGFKKTSDGNYDAEDKKLANLQKCVDEKDATNKKYVDDQFTSVMMTRNVFSKGRCKMGELKDSQIQFQRLIQQKRNMSMTETK